MSTSIGLRLMQTTAALDVIGGKTTFIRIPVDAVLMVLPGSADDSGMVSVLWESRAVKMFAADLTKRGAQITQRAAAA